MPISDRLLKVGSMAGSMSVYLPAMIFHKGLGLIRVLLFAYFLRSQRGQYGLWALGLMVFSVLAPLVCLGSNHGLARYVSFYEARGRLRQFYRRARLAVLACCLVLSLLALAAGRPITRLVISVCQDSTGASFDQQLAICWAAIGNAFLLALYYNLLSFLGGMRLYRLISAVEIAFGALFAILGCGALAAHPEGVVLLLAHLAALGVALGLGAAMLHVAVHRVSLAGPPPDQGREVHAPVPAVAVVEGLPAGDIALDSPPPPPPAELPGGAMQVLRFGLVALVGGELWVVAGQLSFFLTSDALKIDQGGLFGLFRQLAEPVAFLCGAAWTVVYGHAARRWESGLRQEAVFNLETAYKAVALGTMTLTVILQAASPLWLKVLSPQWREGAALLPGLLLFYEMVGLLGLASMAAWLAEKPALALLPPAAGVAANLLLGAWWMPAGGATGAAWAAGVGMLAGGGLSAVACLLMGRVRLSPGTYFLLFSPAILLMEPLSDWAPLLGWGLVLAGALATPWIVSRRQKAFLWSVVSRTLAAARRRPRWH